MMHIGSAIRTRTIRFALAAGGLALLASAPAAARTSLAELTDTVDSLVTLITEQPLQVEIDPKQPVQWESGQVNINQFALFPVPNGKRLVIESFWFSAGTDAEPLSSVVGFSLRTTVDGTTVEHRFNPGMALGPAGGFGRTYLVDKSSRFYADPNTEVGMIGLNSNSTGQVSAGWSGYFVEAP